MRSRYLLFTILTMALLLPAQTRAADQEAQARELFNTQGCKGCHRIEGSGGNLAPELKTMAKRWSEPLLLQRLITPSTSEQGMTMPSFEHLSQSELEALVFLLRKL